MIQVPVSCLGTVREVQNSPDFVIYSWLRHATQHTYHRVVKLINERCEVVFDGIVFQKGCPRCDWLWLPVGVHLLHGEIKPVRLEIYEHVS
jgi:hypothetical protein